MMAVLALVLFGVPLLAHAIPNLLLRRRMRSWRRVAATVVKSEYRNDEPHITVRVDGRESVVKWPARFESDAFPDATRGQTVEVYVDPNRNRVYIDPPSKQVIAMELGMTAFLLLLAIVLGLG